MISFIIVCASLGSTLKLTGNLSALEEIGRWNNFDVLSTYSIIMCMQRRSWNRRKKLITKNIWRNVMFTHLSSCYAHNNFGPFRTWDLRLNLLLLLTITKISLLIILSFRNIIKVLFTFNGSKLTVVKLLLPIPFT